MHMMHLIQKVNCWIYDAFKMLDVQAENSTMQLMQLIEGQNASNW